MNEYIFLLHICLITIAALGALRLGKEALIAFICIVCILANLFVSKQITLFGLQVTASDSLSIGAGLGLNLLQEYFGREYTKKAIWLSFAAALLCTLLAQLHLFYIPSIFDTMHSHFSALFSLMPRIFAASYITYLIVQHIESRLYAVLKNSMPQQLVFRNFCSMAVCQLLDTILFSFLGLYGTVEHISHIILLSYAIKIIVLGIASPFLWFSKKITPSAQAIS